MKNISAVSIYPSENKNTFKNCISIAFRCFQYLIVKPCLKVGYWGAMASTLIVFKYITNRLHGLVQFKLLILFLLILSTKNSIAQKQGLELVDSLKSELANHSKDTNYINILCRLSFEYHRLNTKLGINYGEQALRLADSLSWKKGLAYAYNGIGVNNIIKGNHPEALNYFLKSLSAYSDIGDIRKVATLCNNIGKFYIDQKNYPKAIEYLNKSLAINERTKNENGLSLNYDNFGIICTQQKQFVQAIDFHNKALKIDRVLNNKNAISGDIANISANKILTKEYCEALNYGFNALKISTEIRSTYNQGRSSRSIGEAYFGLASDSSNSTNSCKYYKSMRRVNFLAAVRYLKEAIVFFSKVNDLGLIAETSLIISKVYESLEDSKNAILYYKKYSENKDSVFSHDNSLKFANIESKLEIDSREKQLQIKMLEVENKKALMLFQIILSALILITISIISYVLYKKQKFQKAINQELNAKNLALQKSEEKLRILFENMTNGYYRSTHEGYYIDANPAYVKMLGYDSKEELLKVYIPTDIYVQAIERDENVRDNPDYDNNLEVYRLKTKDGRIIWIEDNARYIKNEQGEIICHEGICRDITERWKADEELRKSEEKFKDLFENMPNGYYRSTHEGYYVEANPAFIKMLGYASKEELLKVYIPTDIYVHPNERDKIGRENKDFENSYEVYRLKTKDGQIIWIEDNARYIKDENGKIIYHEGICHDITERWKADEELRKSEERFKDLFENMTNGYYRSSHEGYYIDVNPTYVKMLGYDSKEELLKVYIPTDIYVQSIERAENVKDNPNYNDNLEVYRLKTKDGRIIWLEDNARYIKNEQGEIIYHEGICRDITDRKQAEAALRVSEEKFRLLFETMPNGYYRSTKDGHYVDVNPAFVKMLGYESKEELLNVYIPTDVYVEPEEREQFINQNSEFEGELVTFRQKTKDGRIIWLEENARYIKDENGEVILYEGICRDITDRKLAEERIRESEEKLSTLFSSMTEMVVLHELVYNEMEEVINYRIIDCNNSFTHVIGIKKENAIGKLATEVYQVEFPPYLEEFARVAQTGEPYDYSTYFEPLDKHFMVSVVSPKKNHFATITTDITTIKQIQELIAAKKNEIENYLYVASHDLRSPMVNIQGFSQRLQKQSRSIKAILAECQIDAESKAHLDKIILEGMPKTLNFIFSNVTKMDTLINGLLQVSRTGRINMSIQRVDMNQLLKSIIVGKNSQISELSARVIVANLPDCYGDENMLNQLFSNIIGNALKYRDKTKPLAIKIDSQTKYSRVVYSISDTGIGIPARYLGKIWDVFFRVDANSLEHGDGLGLNLAKRITDKHKGKIWVESEEGVGSTFYVELQKNEFSE